MPNHLPVRPNPVATLVGYEQHAVPVADLPDHGPVLVAGHHGAAVEHADRLADERRDRVGAVEQDQVLDGLRASDGALGRRLAAQLAPHVVRLGRVDVPRIGRLEVELRVSHVAAEEHHPAGRPVTRVPAADDLVASRLSVALVVCADDLQRCLVGLGAAGHRPGPLQAARRNLGQLGRQPDHRLCGRALRKVGQRAHLVAYGVGDLGPAVADGDGAEAGEAVDARPALGVGELDAFAVHDDGWAALLGHRHPVAAAHPQVLQRRPSQVLRVSLGGHRTLLRRTRPAPATFPSRTRARRGRRRTRRRSRPPRRALSSAAALCSAPRRRRDTAAHAA